MLFKRSLVSLNVKVLLLVEGLIFLVGLIGYFYFLHLFSGTGDPLKDASFIKEHHLIIRIWFQLIYLVFSIILIPLGLYIYHEFKNTHLLLTQVFFVLNVIWSTLLIAAGMIANVGIEVLTTNPLVSWATIKLVENALGGGNEFVSGLWLITVSYLIFLKKGYRLRLVLPFLGGIVGVITVFPGFEILGGIYGLLFIIWTLSI